MSLVFSLLAVAASVATAQPQAELSAPPAKPAQLGICVLCHGEDGRSRTPVAPNLAAQNAAYMERSLRRFQTGQRDGDGMNAVARMLSDEDIRELAAWYAAQPCVGPLP